ncbi:hypothetical protein RJT34_32415 [Clitoria ternatea]|uniref:BED-type domain-containing protein n=1 Tax=Clitoria ternatea TaxID=43366 RepID=A0AAN9I4J2_CLITE
MAEENTARVVEGNAVRFRPSPLPGHVKPNAPNQDIAWDWNSLKDINNRKQVTCDFYGKITTGGITRAKRHQMGVRGDCGSCHKCPEDVKETLKAAFINKKNERDAYLKETDDLDEDHELVEEISAIRQGKRAASMATSIASSQTASTAKKPKDDVEGDTNEWNTLAMDSSILIFGHHTSLHEHKHDAIAWLFPQVVLRLV